MKKILFSLLVALMMLMFTGCGSNTTKEVIEIVNIDTVEMNETINIEDNEVINVDINDSETINVDVNITISAKESGAYGEGTFDNPLLMANANYKLEAGDVWFMTPSLNVNCTIRCRTLIDIRSLYIEDAELLPIEPRAVAYNLFEFDVNSSYATMKFEALEDGFVTIKGECLDEPKLYNY